MEQKIEKESNELGKWKKQLETRSRFPKRLKSAVYESLKNIKTYKINQFKREISEEKENYQKNKLNENCSVRKKLKSYADVLKFKGKMLNARTDLNKFHLWKRTLSQHCLK